MSVSRIKSLKYSDKMRKRCEYKAYQRGLWYAKIQKIGVFLNGLIEPFCIGLAGWTKINGTGGIDGEYGRLLGDRTFAMLEQSNIWKDFIRFMGYGLITFAKSLADGAVWTLNQVYKLFDFSNSTGVNEYVGKLLQFLWIPCLIAVLVLGFRMIFHTVDTNNYGKYIQNICLTIIVVTGLPALMSSVANITKTIIQDGTIGIQTNQVGNNRYSETNKIIAEYLTDFDYIYDWKNQCFDESRKKNKNQFNATGNWSTVGQLNINQKLSYYDLQGDSRYSLATKQAAWDSVYKNNSSSRVCELATVLNHDEQMCYHLEPNKAWEIGANDYYYRYNIDMLPCLITLLAMAAATLFVALKVCRLLFELVIQRLLAVFFAAADLSGGEKTIEALKAIGSSFAVIIINVVMLKLYIVFSAWLTAQNISGITKALMLVAIAVAVIDGPNLCEKLLGIDAGLHSGVAALAGITMAGHAVGNVGRKVKGAAKGITEFGADLKNRTSAKSATEKANKAQHKANKSERNAKKAENRANKDPLSAKKQRKAENARAKANSMQAKADKKRAKADSKSGEKVDLPSNNLSKSNGQESVASYENSIASNKKLSAGKNADEQLNAAENAFLQNNAGTLMSQAAELQDAAAANGKELSDKDAVTTAFAKSHKDPDAIFRKAEKEGGKSNPESFKTTSDTAKAAPTPSTVNQAPSGTAQTAGTTAQSAKPTVTTMQNAVPENKQATVTQATETVSQKSAPTATTQPKAVSTSSTDSPVPSGTAQTASTTAQSAEPMITTMQNAVPESKQTTATQATGTVSQKSTPTATTQPKAVSTPSTVSQAPSGTAQTASTTAQSAEPMITTMQNAVPESKQTTATQATETVSQKSTPTSTTQPKAAPTPSTVSQAPSGTAQTAGTTAQSAEPMITTMPSSVPESKQATVTQTTETVSQKSSPTVTTQPKATPTSSTISTVQSETETADTPTQSITVAETYEGTYNNANQSTKHKIDNVIASQSSQGNSVQDAKLANYRSIAKEAHNYMPYGNFADSQEIHSHIAAAAERHGYSYNPDIDTPNNLDLYQGNMSMAVAHKDEIKVNAKRYMAEQKENGKSVTQVQAIAHILQNESDYDMSYGFTRQYSADAAEAIIASDEQGNRAMRSSPSVREMNERNRSINGTSDLNNSLGNERQNRNKPRASYSHSYGKKKK